MGLGELEHGSRSPGPKRCPASLGLALVGLGRKAEGQGFRGLGVWWRRGVGVSGCIGLEAKAEIEQEAEARAECWGSTQHQR